MLTVGVLVIATLVGTVLLSPYGKLEREGQFGPIRTLGGLAERIETTALAALLAPRMSDRQLAAADAHGHAH